MDASACLLLSVHLFLFSSGSLLSTAKIFGSVHRHLLIQTAQHDLLQPPITPVTNPVTTPATGTVPSATPAAPIMLPPAAPITLPPATQTPTPVTNPVTTPSTTIPGVQPSVTNPVTTYPSPSTTGDPATTSSVPPPVTTNPAVTPPLTGGNTPAVTPPVTGGNTPAGSGQSWCVAKSGAGQTAIQSALDYACGIADCSAIQMGASCYNPNSLQSHASYAFNSYYQKNPVSTSCDFGGAAVVTNVNPSSGSCIFPTGSSSSSSGSPVTNTPSSSTPTTDSSSGATPFGLFTPSGMNASSPSLGGGFPGFGDSPPASNISSASRLGNLQPFLGCIIVVTTIITGRAVLDI